MCASVSGNSYRTTGHSVKVLHPTWLWTHSSDQQAGLKHLAVVGNYDTTGPLADLFSYIHVKGGFLMAFFFTHVKSTKKVFSITSKLNTDNLTTSA